MPTSVHRPKEPSFIEMSAFACKSSRSHFGRNGITSSRHVSRNSLRWGGGGGTAKRGPEVREARGQGARNDSKAQIC